MNDLWRAVKTRLTAAFRWRFLKYLIGYVLIIAGFFSVMDYTPVWRVWFVEVLRNIVMAASIGLVGFVTVGTVFADFRVRPVFRDMALAAGLLMFSGALGGMIGWLVNKTLFGFYVSAGVAGFMLSMGLFTTLMGIAPLMVLNLLVRLKKTMTRLHERELAAQIALQLKTKAELEALRAKVNPHFLFNTLNSIASLIAADPGRAEKMVQKLANLFRYTLNASNREYVSLVEEISVLTAYLEIEKERFGDRLRYSIFLEPAIEGAVVPGLLLQPLVENSLIHGIDRDPAGGSLTIDCRAVENGCRIEIVNSGKVSAQKGLIKGFGLTAVTERLDLLYGDRYSFSLSPGPPVRVLMTLPRGPDL